MSDSQALCVAILAMICPLLLATICHVSDNNREKFQAEAVQHGAAEWTVDSNGKRVFRWKDQTRKDQP